MARTGRFGRQPRSAPSLTNTLVAIAREFQNQRSQNIMDAWNKGGTFEGQKATDELVLKFWRDKVKGVSKDDPLHDTYANAATQLDYSIHESKMTAKYAQGKATDAEMVSFYMGWAKKLPKNSEFYRVLQRDAGQYMRNQRALSEAEARKRAEERYQRAQANTQKQKEAGGEYTIDLLRRLAQSGNAQFGVAPAISAPGSGSDLTDFDPSDPDRMMRLISLIMPQTIEKKITTPGFTADVATGEFKGNPAVLFHDDDGKAWTGTDIMREIGKLDPNYTPGTPFTVDYVTTILNKQMEGLNERIERANKTGHANDAVSLQKSKSYVSLLSREVAAMPIQTAYNDARATYDAVVADKSASPAAILKAWETYSATLTHLSKDPRIAADDNLRARLVAEVNGDSGVPTLNESFTGLANAAYDPSSAKDAVENKTNIEFLVAQRDAVAKGEAVWTYGERDDNGIFVPKAGGREIGAATPNSVAAGGENVQIVTVDDPRGGVPLQMAITAVPVYAVAKNPATGEPLQATNGNPVAWAYDMPKGSGTKTQYGFMTSEGMVFSTNPPWEDNLKTTSSAKGGNHIEVDMTPVVSQMFGELDPITGQPKTAFDLNKNQDFGNGFHIDGAKPGAKGVVTPGQLVYDPQATAWHTDTRNGLGSTDPMTDFKSLTLATLMGDPEGMRILNNLDKNPLVRDQINSDNYRYAGYEQDQKTGAWVPGTNGDATKLQQAQLQTNVVANSKSYSDLVAVGMQMWQRAFTGSPFKPDSVGNSSSTGALPGETKQGAIKLSSELTKGTIFEALGNAFLPGTNQINRTPAGVTPGGFAIKSVGVIKAPVYKTYIDKKDTGPAAKPNVATGSAPPAQSGSQAPGGATGGVTYGGFNPNYSYNPNTTG